MFLDDQHLYKSPAIDVYGNCIFLLFWLTEGWLFLQSGVEILARSGFEPTTFDLGPKSGAYDLSATELWNNVL